MVSKTLGTNEYLKKKQSFSLIYQAVSVETTEQNMKTLITNI